MITSIKHQFTTHRHIPRQHYINFSTATTTTSTLLFNIRRQLILNPTPTLKSNVFLKTKSITTLISSTGLIILLSSASTNKLVICEESLLLSTHEQIIDQPLSPTSTTTTPTNQKKKSPTTILLSTLSIWDYLLYSIAGISSILGSLMNTFQAKLIGRLFDSLGTLAATDATTTTTTTTATMSTLGGPFVSLFSLFILQSGFSLISSVALSEATNRLGNKLRISFFKSVLKQDMELFDDSKTGELTHQLSQDIGSLQTAVRESFTRGVEGITTLISGSIMLWTTSPKVALGMITLLPLGSFAGTYLGYFLREVSSKARHASQIAAGTANESITSIRTVRILASESHEIEKYQEKLHVVGTLKQQMAIYSGMFYAGISLGVNLITLLVIGVGHQLVSAGELTRGDVSSIIVQVQLLERALARLSVLSASVSKALKNSESVFDMIIKQPMVNVSKQNSKLKSVKGKIEFNNVTFAYPSRKSNPVLEDFTLTIEPGMVVALVGTSGSGKSTCGVLLERFYDPDEGTITLDGIDLRDFDPHWLRTRALAYVPQKPDLFSGTIRDNIRYGAPHASDDEVELAARKAQAHDFICTFPEGYDTILGEQSGLSGGQRQRIAIARALLMNAKVLILDEATSGLDTESEYLIHEELQRNQVLSGKTMLVIAHRLNTIVNANLIVVLEDGIIVEKGTHKELVHKENGIYRAFWNRQNQESLKRRDSRLMRRQSSTSIPGGSDNNNKGSLDGSSSNNNNR
jgi:ATP-binding cassette subfamily B (MDR/TAP) protein 8